MRASSAARTFIISWWMGSRLWEAKANISVSAWCDFTRGSGSSPRGMLGSLCPPFAAGVLGMGWEMILSGLRAVAGYRLRTHKLMFQLMGEGPRAIKGSVFFGLVLLLGVGENIGLRASSAVKTSTHLIIMDVRRERRRRQ